MGGLRGGDVKAAIDLANAVRRREWLRVAALWSDEL
jgi:hypothetical protein